MSTDEAAYAERERCDHQSGGDRSLPDKIAGFHCSDDARDYPGSYGSAARHKLRDLIYEPLEGVEGE